VLSNLRERYASELELAHQFLSGNDRTPPTSPLSEARQEHLLAEGAQCPICLRRLYRLAFNAEHCHPRSMGGENRLHNKIAMCRGCNNFRGLTMETHVGRGIRSSYPANRQRVEEFLLWSLITVDDGLAAGAAIPEVQEIFLEMRGVDAGQDRDAQIFGRLSTWTPGKVEPTELRDHQPQQEVVQRPSLASTTSDDTFDLFHISSKGGMRFPKNPIVVARFLLALEQERGSESSLSHSARSIREQVDGMVRTQMEGIIWRIASVTAQPVTKVPTNWSSMPNPAQLCLLMETHTLASEKIQSKSDDRYVKAYFGEVLSHLPKPVSEAPVSPFSRLRKWVNSVLARFKGSPQKRQDSLEEQVLITETSGDSVTHSSTPVSDEKSVTEVGMSENPTSTPEKMQTDIKVGIRGFSASSKSCRMPRDPLHLLHILQLIASFDLDEMTYYELYDRLRGASAQPPPPSSMLRAVVRIRELSELEKDDPVDAVLLGDETVVVTALHRHFVEHWIPYSISDESPFNEIDVREVNHYFRTIGSTYMS